VLFVPRGVDQGDRALRRLLFQQASRYPSQRILSAAVLCGHRQCGTIPHNRGLEDAVGSNRPRERTRSWVPPATPSRVAPNRPSVRLESLDFCVCQAAAPRHGWIITVHPVATSRPGRSPLPPLPCPTDPISDGGFGRFLRIGSRTLQADSTESSAQSMSHPPWQHRLEVAH
jgi:hypothetical protein